MQSQAHRHMGALETHSKRLARLVPTEKLCVVVKNTRLTKAARLPVPTPTTPLVNTVSTTDSPYSYLRYVQYLSLTAENV